MGVFEWGAIEWWLFGAIGLLTVAFLMLAHSHRQLQSYAATQSQALGATKEETRRAHVRLDNQQRQLEAMAKELGWADDRAYTKVLTERVTLPDGE